MQAGRTCPSVFRKEALDTKRSLRLTISGYKLCLARKTYKKLIFNQEKEIPFEENLKQAAGITLDQLYAKAAPHVLAGFKGSKRTT